MQFNWNVPSDNHIVQLVSVKKTFVLYYILDYEDKQIYLNLSLQNGIPKYITAEVVCIAECNVSVPFFKFVVVRWVRKAVKLINIQETSYN